MNDRRGSIFRRAESTSIIDLSFVSDGLVSWTAWKLTEDFTNSGHQAIVMNVIGGNTRGDGLPKFTVPKWKDSHFSKEMYKLILPSAVGISGRRIHFVYSTLHEMLL